MNSNSSSSRRRSRPGSFNNKRNSPRGGNRSRGGNKGQYIDPARFIKAAKEVEVVEYNSTNSFDDFKMHDQIKQNLVVKGFKSPTQIQDESIPYGLDGKDVVGIANTGTGKTAAFMLPIINKLMADKTKKALIVAPTRELALQIQHESRAFAAKTGLFDVLIIGGTNMGKQIRDLQRNPSIIIGTPGRLKDHLERGTLKLGQANTVVLDEVDRMLDMGFIVDIRMILSKLPAERQSLFFSATMSPTIETLIRTFTSDPITIRARTSETSDNVEQSVIKFIERSEKMDKLHNLLTEHHVQKVLVFGETKRSVDRLSNTLVEKGHKADSMHGGKSQSQRQRALKKFRENHINILVATDVAARGIDVKDVTHVVNFDLPQSYDDYTHRIGRTGRGNSTGNAVTFVQGVDRSN